GDPRAVPLDQRVLGLGDQVGVDAVGTGNHQLAGTELLKLDPQVVPSVRVGADALRDQLLDPAGEVAVDRVGPDALPEDVADDHRGGRAHGEDHGVIVGRLDLGDRAPDHPVHQAAGLKGG